ncbi:tryptophan synthase subunit alpha [Lentisalinibacter orientalis]|uniref:tryptophan synthase subunit alpha n=1 Tax=Lentisalinibacter orientalis TaxID=2992241 RepID=UPI003868C3E0
MQPHETITRALREATAAGRVGLVPFLTAGYPKADRFADDLATIAAVGDVVEVGVPFSDPMADGMTIQRSSRGALEQGVSLTWIFDRLEEARDRIEAPVILMSYLNPLLAYGYERVASRSLEAGVAGFIVPDLPWEESREFGAPLEEAGLALVQLVTPATPEARLARLCGASRGFVYAVTMRGITGGGAGLPADTSAYLDRVRDASELPVCAGFGIRTAEQVAEVGRHADGVIVGSALVEVLERGDDPAAFLESLRAGPG